MHGMTWEAAVTMGVLAVLLAALIREWSGPDVLLAAAAIALAAIGEFAGSTRLPTIAETVAALGNPGLATVGVLFVVVAGLTHTRAMQRIAGGLIGAPRTPRAAQLRLLAPVVGLSAFLNNTPVVAMFLPVVDELSKRSRVAASQLYMPMAFAATFGGVCTLIGTSTNVVVNGLWMKETGGPGLAMFDLAWVGIPGAVVGLLLMMWLAPRVLADRKAAIDADSERRQYFLDLVVAPGGRLVGKTVEEAGLRRLAQLFLVEVQRQGEVVSAVSSRFRLEADDRLGFVGDVEAVRELTGADGLTAPPFSSPPTTRSRLIEAVVSPQCPLVGTTIRDGLFRARYDAAVVAVARGSQRLSGRLGDIELSPGDTLLLEGGEDFVQRFGQSHDFYLVSGVDGSDAPATHRAPIAMGILLAMVVAATFGWCDLLTAGALAAAAMVATGCCTVAQARASIDWTLLVAIAASLGIGLAMKTSGLADALAGGVIGIAGDSPWRALAAVYVVTMVLTELVTNNAAAVLVYPLAMSTARTLGVDETPFIIAVMVGASAGFATPFGYQTNLMVYGPGGYKFTDYMRMGIPLDLAFAVVTIALAPLCFPFHP